MIRVVVGKDVTTQEVLYQMMSNQYLISNGRSDALISRSILKVLPNLDEY